MGPWRVGDRVKATYHGGYTYDATIAGVQKLKTGGAGYKYTVDWDDGDQHCRQRSEDQVFAPNEAPDRPGEAPDKDGDRQPEIKEEKQVVVAAASVKVPKLTLRPPAPSASSTSAAPASSPAPAAQAAEQEGAGGRPARVRKRKTVFDPGLENDRPQWANSKKG